MRNLTVNVLSRSFRRTFLSFIIYATRQKFGIIFLLIATMYIEFSANLPINSKLAASKLRISMNTTK